jgi:hypothetical protein
MTELIEKLPDNIRGAVRYVIPGSPDEFKIVYEFMATQQGKYPFMFGLSSALDPEIGTVIKIVSLKYGNGKPERICHSQLDLDPLNAGDADFYVPVEPGISELQVGYLLPDGRTATSGLFKFECSRTAGGHFCYLYPIAELIEPRVIAGKPLAVIYQAVNYDEMRH